MVVVAEVAATVGHLDAAEGRLEDVVEVEGAHPKGLIIERGTLLACIKKKVLGVKKGDGTRLARLHYSCIF